jgi:hypothetical protein
MLQSAWGTRGDLHVLVVENSVDTFHDWDPQRPAWMETFWYGAWIPEIATSVYLYHWFRPVLGIYGGGCIVWDNTAYLPWDIPVFHYDVNRPLLAPADLRALSLDCGTRLRTVEEGRRYEMAYRSGEVDLELAFEAVTPPTIVSGRGMGEFFNGHIDQAGRYVGRLKLGSQTHRIDCHGIRDRSWGPRVITDDIRMNYCHGQSEKVAFVCYSKPNGIEEAMFKGYLSLDGHRADLATGTRRSVYRNQLLERVEIELTDVEGRTLTGSCQPVNRMVYEPYPNLVTWLYLVKWQVGETVLYGEEQDVWSIPLWKRRDRSARM